MFKKLPTEGELLGYVIAHEVGHMWMPKDFAIIWGSFLISWSIFGAGQGTLGTRKRNRSNDLD